jgi:phenylalanyl-tRNA synthetase beta chain
MKISLSWLKEFVDLDIDANEVAQRLTLAGVEVSSVHALTEIPASVVVARIITRSQHPNADSIFILHI